MVRLLTGMIGAQEPLVQKNTKDREVVALRGNRCGHDPAAPRQFTPPAEHSPRPKILQAALDRLWRYYSRPAQVLPSLNIANGSTRQQRSERREACILLASTLVHYLDLVTLRVGVPQDDGSFRGLTLPFLATASGMHLRRAERACHDLVAAGVLTVHPIAQRDDAGEYSGLAAIRAVSRSFFKALGLSQWLEREREKASKRRRKIDRREESIGRLELLTRGTEARTVPKRPAPAGEGKPAGARSPSTARQALADMKSLLGKRGPP